MGCFLFMVIVFRREAHPAQDDVLSCIEGGATSGVGVGSQEQERLGEADRGLYGDHPGGLVDLGTILDRVGKLRVEAAA